LTLIAHALDSFQHLALFFYGAFFSQVATLVVSVALEQRICGVGVDGRGERNRGPILRRRRRSHAQPDFGALPCAFAAALAAAFAAALAAPKPSADAAPQSESNSVSDPGADTGTHA